VARPESGLRSAKSRPSSQRDRVDRLAILHPGRSTSTLLGRLPAQPTPLIGRESDIAAIRREILDGDGRLLTLSGPPGVGKTRLAIEAAAGLEHAFEHGVFFADLSPVRETRLVASAMTRALGIWETGRGSARATLETFLHDRELLLVLDNFEQVVDAAPYLADLLAECPRLALLVTSRAALRVRWEQELVVAPLELPDRARSATVPQLLTNPAVALFVDRAETTCPGFALSDQSAQAVAEICIRLDGLPLAIELAATQVKLLLPSEILAQLSDASTMGAPRRLALGVLTGGARDLPVRQRTLRDSMKWSYELLSPPQQEAFRRLAIFPGSFSLGAAAAVVGEEHHDPHTALSDLIDNSLVRREPATDGALRFRILQTLREYGLEQLEACGEGETTRRRLAAYFVAFAQQALDGLWGPDQAVWLERMEADLDSVRAVLEWSAAPFGDLEAGLIVAGDTCRFWDMRGYFAEGRARLGSLLARADASPGPRSSDHVTRAEVFVRLAAGFLAFAQGDFQTSTAHIDRALPMAEKIGFTFGVTTSLVGLASMAQIRGDLPAATELLDRSLANARKTGDGPSLYHTLYWQGEVARSAGEYDRAVSLIEESLVLTRRYGNPWLVATALFSLGHVALVRGDPAHAAALFGESLTMRHPLRDQLGIALSVEALAWVAAANHQAERAARLFGAADGLRERIGASVEVGWMSHHQQFLERTGRMLDEATFAARWSDGQAMAPDQAIALALATDVSASPSAVTADPTRATRPPGGLTEREVEVAALIARGLTNRQIAGELVVARGTVANHVAHILDKLGFHTRAQIAGWAVEHRIGGRASSE
jgi:non-specific serine/threonine protein kinase